MKNRILIPAAIVLMGVGGGAWADKPDEDGEVTIRLMPAAEVELPEAVTNPLELPSELMEDPDQAAKLERARKALEDATAHRNSGRDHGLSHAEQAREQAQDMANNAKANRESRGRSEDRPEPPGRPDEPGPPDNPGRP